jgi:hypothetical protein
MASAEETAARAVVAPTQIDKIRAPGAWGSPTDAAVTGARVIGCGLLAPFCLAQELGTRDGIRAGIAARQQIAELQASGESFLDDLGENGAQLLNAGREPLAQIANTSMWIAIGMIALAAIVVVTMIVIAVKT